MFYIFFVILLSFLVQIQLLPLLGIRLDLLLFITLYYSLLYGWRFGAVLGLLLGLLQDIFSLGMLGLGTVGFIICGLLAGYSRKMLLLRYWIVRVGLVFILSILNLLIYYVMSKIFLQTNLNIILKNNWLVIGLGNTILAGIVFWLVDRYG